MTDFKGKIESKETVLNDQVIVSSLLTQIIQWSFLLLIVIGGCKSDDSNDLPEVTYNIGDAGPSGGIVFYDKGTISDGWRYIEVGPMDLGTYEWGCFDTPTSGASSLDVGMGLSNTEAIVAFHDSLNDYYGNPSVCSSVSDGSVAAKTCFDLEIGSFDDWHLPSQDEVFLMYENLHLNGLGDFNSNLLYWTSTEHDNNTATATDFETGDQGWLCKQCSDVATVRPVRYF